jgi:NAD dependent epimerase/dehydratase family enzyme
MGSGRQWLAWVHVHDVVRAFAHVWASEEAKALGGQPPEIGCTYNFTAPGAVSQAAFARSAASVMRRPCWLPAPAWAVRLALGEQADLLLEGQRVAPKRLLQEGFRFSYPEIDAALKNLLRDA